MNAFRLSVEANLLLLLLILIPWQQMIGIMMETAQDISGMTKGPPRHKETWWWNEEVVEAVKRR